MNQRIRELEAEAYKWANAIVLPDDYNTAAISWHRREAFTKKFSELIVLECANLFDKNETDVRIPEYRAHDSIMIHFGLY